MKTYKEFLNEVKNNLGKNFSDYRHKTKEEIEDEEKEEKDVEEEYVECVEY